MRHDKKPAKEVSCVSHALYCQQTSGGIFIVRLLHGRMDPARHLA
jgi:toxin ParE1/3/4